MNILINMDGVIARYKKIGDENSNIIVEPDNKMINVVEKLSNMKNINLKIITNLSKNGKKYLECIYSKKQWLKKHCPFIDIENQFIATIVYPRDVMNLLCGTNKESLTYDDILIGTTNSEAVDWRYKGGFAIKYKTDTVYPDEKRTPSFDGLTLTNDMSSDEIYDLLEIIINQFTKHFNDRKEEQHNEN